MPAALQPGRYAIAVALALAAGAIQSQTVEPAQGAEQGAELLQPFKRDLQGALRQGLAQGPADAVTVCRLQAPEIAKALSQDGIRLGRASHALRNPANVAPEWVRPILEAYVASASDRAPRTVPLPDNRLGYVEPILTQPLCLACHGADLAPDVSSRIDELYPQDRAVGFQVGDLRGVFWVEFPDKE